MPIFTSKSPLPQLPPDKRKDPYRTPSGLARLILAAVLTPIFAHKILSAAARHLHIQAQKTPLRWKAISCWLAVDFVFRAVREIRLARQGKGVLDLSSLGRGGSTVGGRP